MITADQFREIFQTPYRRETWVKTLNDMLGRIEWYQKPPKIDLRKNEWNARGLILGRFVTTDQREIGIYEVSIDNKTHLERNRVGLRNLLKKVYENDVDGALIIFDQGDKWRFSYVSEIWSYNPQTNKREKESTDPKRYTYLFGRAGMYRTPISRFQRLQPGFIYLKDISQAFSVTALNEEFYHDVVAHFYQLTGATIGSGRNKIEYQRIATLPSLDPQDKQTYQEFAVRLIGRIIFCWFLKFKRSEKDIPLLPEELLSSDAVKRTSGYYHEILERLFFQALNTPIGERKKNLPAGSEFVPFLNGGLFEPHMEDFYKPDQSGYSKNINSLKITDSWFLDFFRTLEQYNFTIDENSIEDAEVSIDPEMLGRIFENLLAEMDPDSGESARKATGSFYTPREIVDYMVSESLVQYLHGATGLSQKRLHELFSPSTPIQWSEKDRLGVLQALEEVKILDPACGSGAFPIGALQKLSLALEKLDPDAEWWKDRQVAKIGNALLKKQIKRKLDKATVGYTRKLGLIQNNIYGVDIQPIAAEISKLRCFLTLIVDETINDQKDNRGIEPLPNLEFKFVAANTLYPLPQKQQTSFFDSDDDLLVLQQLRLDYLQAFGEEKESIKKRFSQVQTEIFKAQLKNSGDTKSRAMMLAQWNPFSDDKVDWFDPEWMYGISQFHIVIGNPPYGGDKIAEELKAGLGLGSRDPYGAFLARFLHKASARTPLTNGGVLSFIVSDTFMTIKTHLPLRQLLMENTLQKMIRLHPDTFKATVNTAVIIAHRGGAGTDRLLMADLTQVSIHEQHQQFVDLLHKTVEYTIPLHDREESRQEGGALYMQGTVELLKDEKPIKWTSESSPTYAVYTYPQQLIKTNSNTPFFVASPKLFALMNDTTIPLQQIKINKAVISTRTIIINNKKVVLVKLGDIAEVKVGLQTGDNDAYLFQNPSARGNYRNINEYKQFLLTESDLKLIRGDEELRLEVIEKGISKSNVKSKRYFSGRYIAPYDKGGESDAESGWMPNYHVPTNYFIDWSEGAVKRMKALTTKERNKHYGKPGGNDSICSRFQNIDSYFIPGISFSRTGIYCPTFRFSSNGPFDTEGSMIFIKNKKSIEENIAVLCSALSKMLFKGFIGHTIHSQIDELKDFVFPIDGTEQIKDFVRKIVQQQKKDSHYDYLSNEQTALNALINRIYGLIEVDILELDHWTARRYPRLAAAKKEHSTKVKN